MTACGIPARNRAEAVKQEFRDGAGDAPSLYFLREVGSISPENAVDIAGKKIQRYGSVG
jgi:hypothetical protein